MYRRVGIILPVVIDKFRPLLCVRFKSPDFQLTGCQDVVIDFEFRHDRFAPEEGDLALRHFDGLLPVG